MFNDIFGIIFLAFAVYVFYGYYKMTVKKEILQGLFLSKDLSITKCKDKEGYMSALNMPTLILGIATLAYGVCDLLQARLKIIDMVYYASLIFAVLALFYFGYATRKAMQKFF